jgi:hypothetical protein
LERFSPRKFASALRPPPNGGSPEPFLGSSPEDGLFGRKLFIEAHASISVPSTEK